MTTAEQIEKNTQIDVLLAKGASRDQVGKQLKCTKQEIEDRVAAKVSMDQTIRAWDKFEAASVQNFLLFHEGLND